MKCKRCGREKGKDFESCFYCGYGLKPRPEKPGKKLEKKMLMITLTRDQYKALLSRFSSVGKFKAEVLKMVGGGNEA